MNDNNEWHSVKRITEDFRQFCSSNEEWMNDKWLGRALKRLVVIKERKRTNRGIEVKLDIEKAKEKIKIYK